MSSELEIHLDSAGLGKSAESYMRTHDNNQGDAFVIKTEEDRRNLLHIANKSLLELEKENPNLLVFPSRLGAHNDEIEKKALFHLDDKNTLTTYNYMGFVGCNDSHLAISSRFYPAKNDFFLHYMLQRVLALNIVDLKVALEKHDIWDIFLLYLFPYYLQRAINQGLYKEYKRKQYNNAHVKGAINVPKHIRQNTPFMGNIAYTTREHSYDNRITQLIRHTIEYIKNHDLGQAILAANHETRINANQIIQATPSYNCFDRQDVMQLNHKKAHHPFFTEYEILRRICLQILRKEGLSYGKEKDKVYGLVFDGAWLWEEYLHTLLKDKGFIHSENKTGKNPAYLFEKTKDVIYPDFYMKDKMVLDAKYKRLEEKVSREDKYQIITYLHVLGAKIGGLVFPSSTITQKIEMGILKGYGGIIYKYPLHIAQNVENWSEFKEKMYKEEIRLWDEISTFP